MNKEEIDDIRDCVKAIAKDLSIYSRMLNTIEKKLQG